MAKYNKFTDRITNYVEYETTIKVGMPFSDVSCKYCPFYKRNMDGQHECCNPNTSTQFIPYLPKDVVGIPYWCPLEPIETKEDK